MTAAPTKGTVAIIGAGLGGIALVAKLAPAIDGLIALTSAMLGRDFRGEGRNLEALGLAGRSLAEIRALAEG